MTPHQPLEISEELLHWIGSRSTKGIPTAPGVLFNSVEGWKAGWEQGYEKGAIAMYSYLRHHTPQEPGDVKRGEGEGRIRWIKASERLPKVRQNVFFRWKDFQNSGGDYGYVSEKKQDFVGQRCGFVIDKYDIEWLEEELPAANHPEEGTGIQWHKDVEDFHEKFNVPVYSGPTLPTTRRAMFRSNILLEEVKELQQALYDGDYAGIADGIVDCIYVLIGTAHEHGLGRILPELFAEVHRSNMSKLGADGKPVLREDGKVLKGPNFSPPNLTAIIDKYLERLPPNL